MITNCSNNYGPYQFPEKLIPLIIANCCDLKPLPVYGSGESVRDWLYVEDHISAMDLIFHKGALGETYLIGGRCERSNLAVAKSVCKAYDTHIGQADGTAEKLITFVPDRPGHDNRYAIDPHKLESTLGWSTQTNWEVGIQKTISSYLDKI